MPWPPTATTGSGSGCAIRGAASRPPQDLRRHGAADADGSLRVARTPSLRAGRARCPAAFRRTGTGRADAARLPHRYSAEPRLVARRSGHAGQRMSCTGTGGSGRRRQRAPGAAGNYVMVARVQDAAGNVGPRGLPPARGRLPGHPGVRVEYLSARGPLAPVSPEAGELLRSRLTAGATAGGSDGSELTRRSTAAPPRPTLHVTAPRGRSGVFLLRLQRRAASLRDPVRGAGASAAGTCWWCCRRPPGRRATRSTPTATALPTRCPSSAGHAAAARSRGAGLPPGFAARGGAVAAVPGQRAACATTSPPTSLSTGPGARPPVRYGGMLFAGPPRFFTLEAGSLVRSYVDAGGRVAWLGTGGLTQPVGAAGRDARRRLAGRPRRNLLRRDRATRPRRAADRARRPDRVLRRLGRRPRPLPGGRAQRPAARRGGVARFGRAASQSGRPWPCTGLAREWSRAWASTASPRGAQLPDPRADNAQAMDPALALGEAAEKLGVVVAAGRRRRRARLARPARPRRCDGRALVVATVVLVGHIWNTDQFRSISGNAALFTAPARARAGRGRGPGDAPSRSGRRLFPLLAVAVLPFRVPIDAGGSTVEPARAALLRDRGSRRRRTSGGSSAQARSRRPPATVRSRAGARCLPRRCTRCSRSTRRDFETALEQIVFFYVPFALLFRLAGGCALDRTLLVGCTGVLVVLALAFSAIGFWEYGQRELLWNPKVISANQFESYFRVNSVFWDPNIYGRFLAIVMVVLAAAMLWTAAATGARDRGRAGGPVGRAGADVLAVELRLAAGRPRRARGSALGRAPHGRRHRRGRGAAAPSSCSRSRARCGSTSAARPGSTRRPAVEST